MNRVAIQLVSGSTRALACSDRRPRRSALRSRRSLYDELCRCVRSVPRGRGTQHAGRVRSPFSIACRALVIALTISLFSETLLAQTPEKPKRNLLFIGQAKGYQHEAISTAMATLYNLGRNSGLWNTQLRTDCTAITKKPLKWEARNLDAFDGIVFFTDGDLDMDASQKADLLSFVRDDGKGFIGIHSAAITFTSWPEYGQMLGGYFDGHPWGQFNAPLVVEDSTFPGMNNFPATLTLFDEIYQFKDF